jgi:hypothetical protein
MIAEKRLSIQILNNFKMKKLFLLILLLNSIFVEAQESQSKLAATFSDGPYTWFRSLSGESDPTLFEDDGPTNLKFIKNDDKEVVEIQMEIDGKWISYFPDAKGVSSYVRYYRSSASGSNRCLYIDKKGIWVIEISSYYDSFSKISAFLGKKEPSGKGMVDRITKYLEDAKVFQEKDKAAVTIKDHEITSIVPELVFKNEAKVGESFQIGITTTRDDGTILKNAALGGNQNDKDYEVYVGQRSDIDPEKISFIGYLKNCDDFKDEKVRIIIKRTDLLKVVFDDYVSAPCFYSTFYLDRQKQNSAAEKQKIENDKKNNPYGITIYSKDGKFGLKDSNNKVTVDPIYDSLVLYKETLLCKAKLNSKYGVIDNAGKIILPINYDKILTYTSKLLQVKSGNKWGIVNMEGKNVLPVEYDKIDKSGNYGNRIYKDGKMGIIDLQGKILLQPLYTKLRDFDDEFGIAPAQRDGKYGYVNKEGVEVIPFIYSNILAEVDPSGVVAAKKDTKWGIVNLKGEQVEPFIYEYDMFSYFKADLAIVGVKESKNDKYKGERYGMIDKTGKVVIEIIYKGLGRLRKDKYIEFQWSDGGNWGLLNSDGKMVLYPNYDEIGLMKNGYMIVKRGDNYGYLDKNFINVTPINYSSAKNVEDGYASVVLNNTDRDLKVKPDGKLELVSTSDPNNHKYGGTVFVLNDTEYTVSVTNGTEKNRIDAKIVQPGEMINVSHIEGNSIYVSKFSVSNSSEEILMKELQDPGQSGMVFHVSPHL